MAKNEAMKMMMGSTWKANTKPIGGFDVPRSPKTNVVPASAYPNIAFTPPLMDCSTSLAGVFSTITAKANCRPSPHATMRSLMARLCVEHSQANPMIASRPSTPV